MEKNENENEIIQSNDDLNFLIFFTNKQRIYGFVMVMVQCQDAMTMFSF